jgi:hypothetical protein
MATSGWIFPLVIINDQRRIATGEEMPRQIVPPVEATGVSAQKPFHPNDEIGLGRFDHQMKMIWHQDIGVNLPTGLDANKISRAR